MNGSRTAGSLNSYRFRLTVLTIAFFLVFKLIKLSSVPRELVLPTWAFEACVGLWIFAASTLLGRLKPLEKLHVSKGVFGVLYLLHYTLCFFTVYFFHDNRLRKYSLLDMGPDALGYLIQNVAPWQGIALWAGVLVALCALAILTRRVSIPGRLAPLVVALLVVSVVVCIVAGRAKEFPTPLWDLALDLAEVHQHPAVVRPDGPVRRHPVELLNRASAGPVRFQSRFNKVIVFVMESVTLRHFLDSRAALAPETFFNRIEPNAHVYSDFFTNDMDSRTGLLALLTSRFVPYEAYRDPRADPYGLLGSKPSLVDVMRDNGYFTAIATAQVIPEPVVKALHWDENLMLTELQTKALSTKHLCVNPYRFEDSCEDKVMLPQLFARLAEKPKLFWVQQLVWGHHPNYARLSGKTDVQYYSEMLDELVDRLREQGQLDETLIVVTADHGIRERGTETLVSTYRIPLLLYSPSFQHRENVELHSQIDFKDILLAGLTETEHEIRGADFALFMGPTYSSIVGAVTRQHDFMVIKNRPWARYVLMIANVDDETRPEAPLKDDATPYEFLGLLDDYRHYFLSTDLR